MVEQGLGAVVEQGVGAVVEQGVGCRESSESTNSSSKQAPRVKTVSLVLMYYIIFGSQWYRLIEDNGTPIVAVGL